MSNGISYSMLKKIKLFLLPNKSENILPSEALKMQMNAYILDNSEVKRKYSPTYLQIAEGLYSKEYEIFVASTYYLVKTALNKSKYKYKIIDIIREALDSEKLSNEFKIELKNELKKIV